MSQPVVDNSPEKVAEASGTGVLGGDINFTKIYDLRNGSIKPADSPRDPQGKDRVLYFGPEERGLVENFTDLIGQMELGEVLELAPDRTKPPKTLSRYKLVPLKIESSQYTNSALGAAMRVEEVDGIKFDYNGEKQSPWLDTSFAIGLAYDGTLSAVAGAHTTAEGHLRIAQIQCVAPPPNPKKGIDKYSSGLHSGFLWRHTLVRAWLQLAEQLGISTVEILSADNNQWANANQPDNHKRFLVGYDRVGQDLGFIRNQEGNWELSGNSNLTLAKLVGRAVLDKQAA